MLARIVLFSGLLACAATAGAESPAPANVEEVVVTAKYAGSTLTESLLASARPSFEPPAITIAMADLEPPRLTPRTRSVEAAGGADD